MGNLLCSPKAFFNRRLSVPSGGDFSLKEIYLWPLMGSRTNINIFSLWFFYTVRTRCLFEG